MSRFLFVRHATNDWVDSQRLAGRSPGVHLNERGMSEAAALAAGLDGVDIAGVHASPLERTMETARWLASPRGLEPIEEPGLLEIDFGQWQGKSLDELREDPLWSLIQARPSHARFPGGETPAEAQARAVAAVEALRLGHAAATLALVTHADIIKLLLAYYAGLHIDHYQRFEVQPASLSIVRWQDDCPRIIAVNSPAPRLAHG
jgi:probable phosphoglycerate mutase